VDNHPPWHKVYQVIVGRKWSKIGESNRFYYMRETLDQIIRGHSLYLLPILFLFEAN